MHLKKIVAFIWFSLLCSICLSKTIDTASNSIKQEISNNISQIEQLRTQIQEVKNFNEASFNRANQISDKTTSYVSIVLTVMTVLLAIIAIFIPIFGWYINKKANQVKHIKKGIETLKKEVIDFVDSNSYTIYERIVKTDTKRMLEHLNKCPHDILNTFPLLATRLLNGPYEWALLKNAFIKLPKERQQPDRLRTDEAICNYVMLILQHYPDKLINNDEQQVFELIYEEREECSSAIANDKEITTLIELLKTTNNTKFFEIIVDTIILGNSLRHVSESVAEILTWIVSDNKEFQKIIEDRLKNLSQSIDKNDKKSFLEKIKL